MTTWTGLLVIVGSVALLAVGVIWLVLALGAAAAEERERERARLEAQLRRDAAEQRCRDQAKATIARLKHRDATRTTSPVQTNSRGPRPEPRHGA